MGSFGDNELSPECLDGAQSFLKRKTASNCRIAFWKLRCALFISLLQLVVSVSPAPIHPTWLPSPPLSCTWRWLTAETKTRCMYIVHVRAAFGISFKGGDGGCKVAFLAHWGRQSHAVNLRGVGAPSKCSPVCTCTVHEVCTCIYVHNLYSESEPNEWIQCTLYVCFAFSVAARSRYSI